MAARVLASIEDVPAARWNALNRGSHLFVRHEFLAALERASCVAKRSGWTPSHLLLENERGELEGAVPLYRKTHSWGEFVFDWRWARAWAHAGLHYYPKLVSMTPFTPATGPRLLTLSAGDSAARTRLAEALVDFARSEGVSSAHVLFIDDEDRAALTAPHYLLRNDCQFHWRNQGYGTFEDFLATFRAEKRKKALRERRRVREAGVEFDTYSGGELDPSLWRTVFAFSAATFAAHGQEHYLNRAFFTAISAAMPEAVMVKVARYRRQPIAAAIFFRSPDTLYGRYWGAAANFHSLHFETCYYQGVEYCIEHGLRRFEPGTQGEHKVPRGFEPTATWSAHFIADPHFARAIEAYLAKEREGVDQYMREVRAHLPFRRDSEHHEPMEAP
ncbi:MAG TPA: GNAT family N-acetyltransferase [Steroidobacter sp.]|nr:GNAT family N-acetyltransferase [Steroidobacter sp.]